MEFILEDGHKIKLISDEENESLIAEIYDDNGEFLERERIVKEDIYSKLFC